jgi:hypothetical protein
MMNEFDYDINKYMRVTVSTRFKGGGGGGDQQPKYTKAEEQVSNMLMNYIGSRIGQTATPYEGETYAGAPPEFQEAIDTYNRYTPEMRDATMQATLQAISGDPAFKADPDTVTGYWNENLSKPQWEMFREEAVPTIKEEFSSGLYSTRAAHEVARQSTSLSANLGDRLFQAQLAERLTGAQSQENAANRAAASIPTAANLAATFYAQDMMISKEIQNEMQNKLNDAYTQFLRMTPEASPWLDRAAQALGANPYPKYDTVYNEEGSSTGGMLGAAGGATAGWLLAGGNIAGWGMTAAPLAALGGPIGLALGLGAGYLMGEELF